MTVLFIVGLYYIRNQQEVLGFGMNEDTLVRRFFYVMGVLSMVWVYAQIYQTTSKERMVEGLDPQLGTMLTPGQTLIGKLSAMLVCILIVQLLELPFFIYAMRMRLDASEWLNFVALFGCKVAAGSSLLAVGCIPRSSTNRSGSVLLKLLVWILLFYLASNYIRVLFEYDEHFRVGQPDIIWILKIKYRVDLLIKVIALSAFASCLGLAFLRNTRQERSWPWRLCVLIVWAVLPTVSGWNDDYSQGYEWREWARQQAFYGFVFAALVAVFSIFERLEPSRRTLQANAGTNTTVKLVTLPFRSGAGAGMVLAWILFLVSLALSSRLEDADSKCQAIAAYLLFYSPLIALLSKRLGFTREAACWVVIAASVFLPLFASATELEILACPTFFFPLMEEEYSGVITVVVALLAVVPGTVAIFKYCSKYFSIKK